MPPGYSSLGGQVVNAYTFGDPSGSSAGSGVAASMALAAATIGTETSGSILSPTSINSDVGVKPTLGLVSTQGILPLAPDFDVPGPIVRHVTDAAIVLGALTGHDYTPSLRRDATILLATLATVVLRVPIAVDRTTGALTLRHRPGGAG